MTTAQQWDNLIGLTATDVSGDKIGKEARSTSTRAPASRSG